MSKNTRFKINTHPVDYRKIYETAYGPIPVDLEGRTYEIHHLDGDHKNNDLVNLKAVTIQEHYDIHYNQGDYGACQAIALRMLISPQTKSELASASALKRLAEGTHNFQGKNNPSHKRVAEGTHNFQGARNPNHRKILEGTHPFQGRNNPARKLYEQGIHPFQDKAKARERALKRVADGTNPLLGGAVQKAAAKVALEEGTHPSQIVRICPHCGTIGQGGGMKRWHMDRCKMRKGA